MEEVKIAYFPSHWDENWREFNHTFDLYGLQRLHDLERFARLGEVVFITPQHAVIPGTVSLVDFVHPNPVTYVFGPSHREVFPEDLRQSEIVPDHYVYIPMHKEHAELFASHAACIVLWDRRLKRG